MAADGSVREIPTLPDGARALTTLGATAGYTDAFVVDVRAAERSAEAWSRLILEQAPASLRVSLPRGWARLGLCHGALGAPGHVLGWPIRDRTEDHVLLGAESRRGMEAELLCARWEGVLLFATVIRFDRAATRVLWAGFERPHKRIVRALLSHAARPARYGPDGEPPPSATSPATAGELEPVTAPAVRVGPSHRPGRRPVRCAPVGP